MQHDTIFYNGNFSFFLIGTHAEVGDGTGVVRGAFSYVDPRQQVRTVEYVADEQGEDGNIGS